MMKAYLSGMPECRFGLNDKISLEKRNKGSGRPGKGGVDIEDISFHQCVRITSAAERGIRYHFFFPNECLNKYNFSLQFLFRFFCPRAGLSHAHFWSTIT
jgi:hypothetical protein